MKRLTRDDIERAYDEIERRVTKEVRDAAGDSTLEGIARYHALQGLYGTLMAIEPDWTDAAFIIDEIERERGYRHDAPEAF